jgi:DNA invertase Pin-like site-specific DNA recombinase
MVSKRTKDALAAAKVRGQRLGGFRGYVPSETDRARAARARAETARERAGQVLPMIRELQAAGITSLAGIARELSKRGVPTPRGAGAWQAVQVARVLASREGPPS